jgi:hypothetical protein
MTYRSALDLVALLACSVYGTIPLFWFVVHPFVERWRTRGRRAYAFIVPVWGGFIAIVFLLMWPFRTVHFYAAWFAWAPAAIFFLVGFSIYRAAFQKFDRTKVSGLAELEPDRHSLARAPSDLSGSSLRDRRVVHRNGIGSAVCAGDLRRNHGRRDDSHGRPRIGSALWGSVSSVSAESAWRRAKASKGLTSAVPNPLFATMKLR